MTKAEIQEFRSLINTDQEARDNLCAFFDLLNSWYENQGDKKQLGEIEDVRN